LGAMVMPQTCDYGGCAIGAAVAAVGRHWQYTTKREPAGVRQAALETWPFLEEKVRHPTTGAFEQLYIVIGALNGWHELNWSRERIADWVATIEPKENHDLQSLANEDQAESSGNKVCEVQQETFSS